MEIKQSSQEWNPQKLLSWPRFYRLLVFFAVLLPLSYLLLTLYRSLVVPFFLSLFFSYFLSPFVDLFDRFKIPRVLVVSLILILTFGIVGFAMVEVFPYLYVEILNLVKLAPKVLEFMTERLYPVVQNYLVGLGFFDENTIASLMGQAQTMVQWSDRIQDALNSIWRSAPQVVGTLLNIVMTPLLTFFFVKDKKRIVSFLTELTPIDLRHPLSLFIKKMSATLHSVIKGQIIVAAILGLLYVIGFSAAGLRAGVAIGLVSGLCRLIPYLDVVVGGFLSLIVIIANWQGYGQLLFVIGVFGVVQTLDGVLITPRIIGERLGVHPLLVIVTVISFADFWGFWGVLLAVPSIAVLKVVFIVLLPYYENSRAYGIVENDENQQEDSPKT